MFVGKEKDRYSDEYIGYLFTKSSVENKYKPKAILVDLESTVLDEIRQGPLKNFFKDENIIYNDKTCKKITYCQKKEIISQFLILNQN